jgi:hypothetical protein
MLLRTARKTVVWDDCRTYTERGRRVFSLSLKCVCTLAESFILNHV